VNQAQPHIEGLGSTVFDTREPVIQSHPLLPNATAPKFGDTTTWDLNGVIRRPANLPRAAWKLCFTGELTDPVWNLLARELSMIRLNPRHPALAAAGQSLKPAPAHPTTVIAELSRLRGLARLAATGGLASDLATWRHEDLRGLLVSLRKHRSKHEAARYVGMLKTLHQLGPSLTGRGVTSDPWAGRSARAVADHVANADLSTPAIPPHQWFPLIRAAWTYVHTFAPDILTAHARHRDLIRAASQLPPPIGQDARLDEWLADPHTRIPVHATPNPHKLDPTDQINWYLLTLQLGLRGRHGSLFSRRTATGRRRCEQIRHAIAAGHPTTTGSSTTLFTFSTVMAAADRGIRASPQTRS
jgi:hypothetical protein